MKRMIVLLLTVLLVLSALSGCRTQEKEPAGSGDSAEQIQPAGATASIPVLSLLKLDPEKDYDIMLSYAGQDVPMSAQSQSFLMEALRESEPCETASGHDFYPSEYQVVFVEKGAGEDAVEEDTGEGAEEGRIYASFAWFGFLAKDEEGKLGFPDLRFDLFYEEAGDAMVLHYRFTGSNIWTEQNSADEYEKQAAQCGLKHRYELDGYDDIFRNIAVDTAYDRYEIPKAETLTNQAESIVIATYLGNDFQNEEAMFTDKIFRIDEVLKGGNSYSIGDEIRFLQLYGQVNPKVTGTNEVIYPEEAMNLEEGRQYVILTGCSNPEKYCILLLEDDTLYPCLNQETHPFCYMPLSELKGMIGE